MVAALREDGGTVDPVRMRPARATLYWLIDFRREEVER